MMPLLDLRPTSSGLTSHPEHETADLTVGLFSYSIFGTSAGVKMTHPFAPVAFVLTAGAALQSNLFVLDDPASKVRRLRDQVSARGLTRQEIAHALGVNRRSLSRWVSGEIHPTPERVRLLGILAELVEAIDAERPGQARDILFARRNGIALVDKLKDSGRVILDMWSQGSAPRDGAVSVTRRPSMSEHIWAAAARALADGRLIPLERAHTVRPESTYEMEPAESAVFAEPEYESRRRGYR